MSTSPSDSSPQRRNRAWLWLILLVLVAGAGGYGWHWWQARQAAERAVSSDTAVRLDALGARVVALREDQRALAQRLQQAMATNRVLRDELLGLGERSALIEDSFARYTDPDRHGPQTLRLDQAELVLGIGEQRLLIAGDLDGARRAYAIAAGVLDGVDDPAYLSVRQTLGQERAALDALGQEPRALALARLEAFARTVTAAPGQDASAVAATAPWWQRAFGGIVEVRHRDAALALDPADRAAAQAGFQLEISLARAAAERRDGTGYLAALKRAEDWLARLVVRPDVLQSDLAQLHRIAAMPLSLALPTLGTTVVQLRQLRATRQEPVE